MLKTAKQTDLVIPAPTTVSVSGALDISGRQMSAAEYAELAATLGATIVCRDGVYWRRVRPFFYRPLLPFEPLETQTVAAPGVWPAGFQFMVRDASVANSTMNFLIYDEPRRYSLEALGHNRRRLIKHASGSFQIRLIRDLSEIKEQGHRVYLSFFDRTRYAYKSERVRKAGFDRWVETLGNFPKAIVLGGYGAAGLVAVSVSYWVKDTLWYATLFDDTAAMKEGVCELMLHELRRMVAGQRGIARMVARRYRGGNSFDHYYLIRGCKLTRLPARLEINPGVKLLLRWCLPREYSAVCGND